MTASFKRQLQGHIKKTLLTRSSITLSYTLVRNPCDTMLESNTTW